MARPSTARHACRMLAVRLHPFVRRLARWLPGIALAACASAPPPSATSPAEPLRVVSYNIRHGAGMDGRVDLARTAATLRALAPDLVALQEVDERVKRSGGVDQAQELGSALGMQARFTSFMDYQGGRYGLAILSRLPIRATRTIPLPPGDEPRAALLVEVELANGEALAFVCIHFNWVADDRVRFSQAETLCRSLDGLAMPYVVVGDFNDQPGSRTLQLFAERTRGADKPAAARFTYPAEVPTKEIDFVQAAPPARWQVGDVRVVDERMASDHRPLLAVLTLLPAR